MQNAVASTVKNCVDEFSMWKIHYESVCKAMIWKKSIQQDC